MPKVQVPIVLDQTFTEALLIGHLNGAAHCQSRQRLECVRLAGAFGWGESVEAFLAVRSSLWRVGSTKAGAISARSKRCRDIGRRPGGLVIGYSANALFQNCQQDAGSTLVPVYNFSGAASNAAIRASKRPAAPPSSTRWSKLTVNCPSITGTNSPFC